MSNWRGSVTRRLGYTTGFIDGAQLTLTNSPELVLTVAAERRPPLDFFLSWWGGTLEHTVKGSLWRRSEWRWTLKGDAAYELLYLMYPFLPAHEEEVTRVLDAEMRKRVSVGKKTDSKVKK